MRPVRRVRHAYRMLGTVVIPSWAQMSGTNVGRKCRARFKEYISNTGSLIEEFSSDVQNFLKQQKALRSVQKTAQTEGQPSTSQQTAQSAQPKPQLTSDQLHGKSYILTK